MAGAGCAPEKIFAEARATAGREGVLVACENALPRFDDGALERIASKTLASASAAVRAVQG